MGKRVFLIVLDSFGIGAEPDAAEWGDEGSNTLCACATTGELKPAPKIFKDTCHIDFSLKAKQVYDFVRGLSPYPGAWAEMPSTDGKPAAVVKIFRTAKTGKALASEVPGMVTTAQGRILVACADEWLEIEELQLAGKKRMEAKAFLNGNQLNELR